MLSKLVFVATLATLASAWTDFHALNPHHKTTELADDRVHTTHDVHHVFPSSEGKDGASSMFKVKYEAIHHKKWHFVELDEHDVDFMKHVECGASEQELFVKHPSQKLRTAVAKQNFEWTVLTAHHQYHCRETAIFRGVTGATFHAETDVLQLHTIQLRYENVFEHLDMKLETDHFDGTVTDHSDSAEDTASLELPEPEEETAVEAAGHEMQQQGWWKRAKKKVKKWIAPVKKIIKKAKTVVKKVVTAVKQVVRTVKSVLSGTYNVGKVYRLKTLNYNKDVSRRFSRWNFVGEARLAVSANAVPTIVFKLQISKMKLTLAETYFSLSYKGGVRVYFSSRGAFDKSTKKTVSLINLQSLSFKIVTIPVVISVTCPITAGYDIDVDGRLRFNFLLSAYGSVKLGVRYTNSRGFQVINEKRLSKTRDFSPRYYRYQVGLQAYVNTMFKASVNFLGFMATSVQITAEATLQSNSKCRMLMQMNLQPIIVAQYALSVTVLGRRIINKSYGPKALVSWKIPVLNYCVPVKRTCRWCRSGKGMQLQAATASGSDSETQPVNQHEVDITKPADIEDNSTGTTWFGNSDCSTTTVTKSLSFSMQFLPGEWYNESNGRSSTQIILTLAHNVSQSSELGDYRMTNMQRTYAMNASVVAGFDGYMQLHTETDPDAQYDASVNTTVDPVVINDKIQIKVDATDATKIQVSASSMFCSTNFINLMAAEYSDDNSTFTVFASGESGEEEESFTEKLKSYVIIVPIVVCVILAVALVAVVMQRKKSQGAHGANWAKSQHDVEPIMGSQAATHNNVNSVAHAPAPTQDSRVAAL